MVEKKRYILFGIFGFYPAGGLDDILFSFQTKEELVFHLNKPQYDYDYYQLIDIGTFNCSEGKCALEAYEKLINKGDE